MSLILFAGFVVYSIYPIIFSFGKTNIEIIPAPASSKHTVTPGALLSLSGASASLGDSYWLPNYYLPHIASSKRLLRNSSGCLYLKAP
jgi:hypothetical protein